MTAAVLDSCLTERFDLVHVDTSDHRSVSHIGTTDVRNAVLALLHARSFLRAYRRARPDLVYVPIARDRTGFLRDSLFLLPTRLAGTPLVVHLHSRDFATAFFLRESRGMQAPIRASLAPPTNAIVLGESRRSDFSGIVSSRRTHVVPNGIRDLGAGAPAGARPPTILHMATLRREKGTLALLEVMPKVRCAVPGAQLLLAGDWYTAGDRVAAKDLVDAAAPNQGVKLLGPITGATKLAALRGAAVFALPTTYQLEAHPVALVEALSTGTPIVATAIGAIPEMIHNGREGFLIEPGDLHGLVSRLVTMLRNPALRDSMGAAGRVRFERDFTQTRFADRLGAAWLTALGSTCTRPQLL